ncbi:uncharacterized protein [Medicago truncatula]|uniref:uncharacterized protein isoform X2 n=1 Tax=Medicago truncatula TaxID=3880 RepID=UPI0019685B86|nr:uncharacterized protein LOC112418034 isoform X2 [Medicago truncatula]
MSSQVNSDIPPSSTPVVMLSAPDTQDNPQEAFHTPPEQASLHSSDVNVVPPSAGSQVLDDPSDDSVFLDEIKNFHDDFQLGFGEDFPPVNDDDPSDNVVRHSAGSQVLDDPSDDSVFLDEIKNFHDDFQLGFGEDFPPVNDDDPSDNVVRHSAGSQVLDDPSDDSVFLDEIKNFHDDFQLGFGEDFPPVNDDDPSDNVVRHSAGSQVLDDPSDDSVFLDEIKNFHDDFQLGFGEDFPPVNDDDPSDNVVRHSAGSQVLDDPSDHSVFLDEIKNFHDDFQLGFGEDFLPVNDDHSCKDIPMDKNSVPEKNAVNDVDLFRETERSSSYEIGEGSRNVNLVEGHNHNRSSGEGGEVSESLNVFDVLRYLANTANKVEDDGLTLLESLKRAGIKFPRPSWWSDDMKSELFNFDDEEQRK